MRRLFRVNLFFIFLYLILCSDLLRIILILESLNSYFSSLSQQTYDKRFLRGSPAQPVSRLLFKLETQSQLSNVWKYLVFYDPTLKIVFLWCFFPLVFQARDLKIWLWTRVIFGNIWCFMIQPSKSYGFFRFSTGQPVSRLLFKLET